MGALERSRFGIYELLHEIGRGGMAELYLARVHGFGGFERWVAIKRILPNLAHDKLFVDMFLNEARIAALLQHRNVCQVFDLCKSGEELLLVMEYLYGVTWDALAKAMPRDATGLRLVAGVLGQACDGLHYAHTLCDVHGAPFDIVHRDVSPQNLLVTADGECKVLDFGVAKMAKAPQHTRTGVLKGKVPYMSPEQLEGAPLDARSDVWALGVVLWEALAGRRLFDRDTEFLTWKAITEEAVPLLGIPAADRVLARALARDRDQRYPSARELGAALAEAAGGPGTATEIAAAVRTHCAVQLAERDRELAAATSKRDASLTYETPPPPDAAETVSMLMRRDSVVVARPRRRWWPLAAGTAMAAAIAVVVIATRSGNAAQPVPAGATSGGTVMPAPSGAASSAGTQPDVAASGGASSGGAGAAHGGASNTGASNGGGSSTRTTSGGASSARTTSGGAGTAMTHGGASNTGASNGGASSTRTTSGGAGTAMTHGGASNAGASSGARLAPDAAADHGTGTYAVDSTPYATIYIDGKLLGDTPLDRVSLAAGHHTVRAVLASGRDRSFAIEITADHKTSSGMLAW